MDTVTNRFRPKAHGHTNRNEMDNYRENRFSKKTVKRNQVFNLEDDTYFQRVLIRFESEFEDDEDKEIFTRNVLKTQFEGQESNMLRTALGDRVFGKLLTHASMSIISSSLSKVVDCSVFLCTDFKGSVTVIHILQVLEQRLVRNETAGDESQSESATIHDFVVRLSEKLVESLDDLMYDIDATYSLQSLFLLLGGQKVPGKVTLGMNVERSSFAVPKTFPRCLKKFVKKLTQLGDFNQMIECTRTSSVIQTLLMVLHDCKPTLCEKLINSIMDGALLMGNMDDADVERRELPIGFTDIKYSHVTEVILKTMSESLFQQTVTCYRPLLATMAVHPAAKYVLQKMIATCHNKKQITSMFKELQSVFDDIVLQKGSWILVHMAEALARFGCKQASFLHALETAFGYADENETPFLEFFLKTSLERSESRESQGCYPSSQTLEIGRCQGSALLQKMLEFRKCREITTMFLALKPSTLCTVACDQHLCYIYDAFFKSSVVTDKEKTQAITNAKEILSSMACSKFGSRVIDAMWNYAGLNMREFIAAELAKDVHTFRSDKFGSFINMKFGLQNYSRNPKEWMQIQREALKSSGASEAQLQSGESIEDTSNVHHNSKKRKSDFHDSSNAIHNSKKRKQNWYGN